MALSVSADEAVRQIKSHQTVFVHGGAATPNVLLDALLARASELKGVELMHMHTEGPAHYADPLYKDSFRVANLFVGSNVRARLDYDRVDYLPLFLSEIPELFRSKRKRVDVAILHLSPPDKHGYCTLGTSVDVARAAFEAAECVIAQINRRMPCVHGDGFVHIDQLDAYTEVDVPLYEPVPKPLSELELAIGRNVSGLIEDGACLQAGIGAIPDAVLRSLKGHRHLGVHSEMWSDGMLDLIECGAVDNSRKAVHAGKSLSGFIIGSRRVYDYIDDNPGAIQLGIDYVNSPNVIARNSKVTAINSAVEIDLTGQVCADSIGAKIISGVGGQMDFMRGAALSKGGKPIIAISSRTKKGQPRVVPILNAGAGVVTTRAHVHFVVTEYGVADLYGKTLGERAKALIAIAHPEDRERLAVSWKKLHE
ncbi:MAG TPA: acetyl-CoA hydrolase/transferase C-terminal domain-containing protein [Bdellovibrionales bacterium]|nr:acetyl-CoA hydrolase/transferase C-terminal domain-containing protein [Bdellovibrionales bacterium]